MDMETNLTDEGSHNLAGDDKVPEVGELVSLFYSESEDLHSISAEKSNDHHHAGVHVESFQIPHLRLVHDVHQQEVSNNLVKEVESEEDEEEESTQQIVKRELVNAGDDEEEDDDYFEENVLNELEHLPVPDTDSNIIDHVVVVETTTSEENIFLHPLTDPTEENGAIVNPLISHPSSSVSSDAKSETIKPLKSILCCNCNIKISDETSTCKNFHEFLPLQYFDTFTGDYIDVQIIEALSDVFKIRWTCSGFGEIYKRDDLSLCLDCASTLAQLYRMYNQFVTVAIKAKSFLSEVINFQKDLHLNDKANKKDYNNESEEDECDYGTNSDPNTTWKRTRRIKKVKRYGEEEEDDYNPSSNNSNTNSDSDMENTDYILPISIIKKKRKLKSKVLVEDSENEPSPVSTNNSIPLKKRTTSNKKLGENQLPKQEIETDFIEQKIDADDNPFIPFQIQQTDNIDNEEEQDDDDEGNTSLQQLLKKITDSPSQDGKKKILKCKECKKEFKFEIQHRIHMNSKKHKDKVKRLRLEKEDLLNEDRPKRNRKSSSKGSSYNCQECDITFATTKELTRHNKTFHDQAGECDRCGKKFKTLGGLKIHYAAHVRDDNKYECKDCGKKFRKKDALELHEKTDHGGFKPHMCTLCDKRFRLKDKLKLHMMVIHEKKKPFPCPKCEKSFRTKYHLKIHDVSQHIQGGDTSIGCSQCKRKFSDREALEKHIAVHEQEKPYVCGLCNKGFHTSARLKLHEKSHQEVPSCLCPVCGRAYKHMRDLKLHEVVHQDESTYRFGCGDCPRRFYRIDLLRVHQSNEKHFGSEVIGPTVSKSLTSNKDVSYFQIKEDMLDEDDYDENETDNEAPPPPPKPKKKRKTVPRGILNKVTHQIHIREREMTVMHPHATVIYHPSSMVQLHLDQPTILPVSEGLRNNSSIISSSSNNLALTAHHQRYTHEAQGSSGNYIVAPRDRQNLPHYSGIQIQPVSSSSHPHIQFGNNTVYTMRDASGNQTLNVANVAGAEQIGFDIITSFINNLG